MKRFNVKGVLLGLSLAVGNASAEMLQLDFMDGVGDRSSRTRRCSARLTWSACDWYSTM